MRKKELDLRTYNYRLYPTAQSLKRINYQQLGIKIHVVARPFLPGRSKTSFKPCAFNNYNNNNYSTIKIPCHMLRTAYLAT